LSNGKTISLMSENMSLLGMYLMKNRGRFIAIYKHASSELYKMQILLLGL
jgi:hypothetical protein